MAEVDTTELGPVGPGADGAAAVAADCSASAAAAFSAVSPIPKLEDNAVIKEPAIFERVEGRRDVSYKNSTIESFLGVS